MNKQLFRFALFLLVCVSLPLMAAAQVEISAVSNVDNPDVGDQIEVSINIARASDVVAYDFTLTFEPTKLEFINIENADYLPTGAIPFPPTVEEGSVKFNAVVLTGTGDGDGTLAIATFRVLATTETTIELEDVEIGDSTAQLLEIASITGTTMNSTNSGTPTVPDTPTTPETPTTPSENVLVTGIRVSAVPSVDNPAIGDQIEVSINIAGGSNVAGYDFTLTFDPTKLEFINIENADYLPTGAIPFPPTVEEGSVKFNTVVLTGTGDGDGTLAIATFRVLATTETTIELEDVEIGDSTAQLLEIASITGATINSTSSTTDSTTETQVETPTAPSTDPPATDDDTASSTTAAQVEISAVSNVDNPAIGDTIEININIAGGSNVAGYDFTLTFDPTKLEFVSIENADFLPAGAIPLPPTVEESSVKFNAVVLTGTGEGDGTLAVATFRVLVKTETTIGLENIEIGDPEAELLTIASVTGATINSTSSTTDSTTETQVETPTAPSTDPPATDDDTASSTTAAQVEISAVSNVDNPAIGDTIEININIAGGLNVVGYDFTLAFDPTKLEFVSIENADFLPAGAFVLSPIVKNGSVNFFAAAASGTGGSDGTLAVATFKVLAETETTVRFEHVEIGDQMAAPLAIASVTGAIINRAAPTVDAEVEYLLSIPAGTNLIHVPLRVTAVNGMARTIASIADLYDALGGASTINFLITYDSHAQESRSYFGASDKRGPGDARLTDDKGVIADLSTPVSVRLTGSALGETGNGIITLNPGLNVVGLPLDDSRITHVSDLFTLNGIGGNVPVIILTDGGGFKTVGRAGDPGDIQITGGQSFILTARRPATVIIYGDGWTNIR